MKTKEQLNKDGVLKDHNISTYQQLESMFDMGASKVGVVQATGTGKSYLSIQWLYDNVLTQKNVRAIYLAPLNGILWNFEKDLKGECKRLGVKSKGVDLVNYVNLLKLEESDLKKWKYDYIILDEFHGLGAVGRGGAIQKLLENNPSAKVLGVTATPIRYLDKKRDMGAELFGDNIVKGMNLNEAIKAGVVGKPDYVVAMYSYNKIFEDFEEKIKKIKNKEERDYWEKQLSIAKHRASEAEGLNDVFARKVTKKDGKYVAFCSNVEELQKLKEKLENGTLLGAVNKDVHVYNITYEKSKKECTRIIEEFEKDNSDAIKVMLSIEMFNEGIHLNGIDGCFLFRPTNSPRLYLQQIGRALSVGGNNHPLIFDVVNNIKCLRNIAEVFSEGERTVDRGTSRGGLLDAIPFDIDGKDLDLIKFLLEVDDAVSYTLITTKQWLMSAQKYANENGNLRVVQTYVDPETELAVGSWINRTIYSYNLDPASVEPEVVQKLQALDPKVFTYTKQGLLQKDREERDRKLLEYFRAYKEEFGNLSVKYDYTTPDGFRLGGTLTEIKTFVNGRERATKYSDWLIEELRNMDKDIFLTDEGKIEKRSQRLYNYILEYYNENKNLKISQSEEAPDGYKLGTHFYDFKNFSRGGGSARYAKWLVDKVLELDPGALDDKETKRQEKFEKLIRGAKEFFNENKHLRVPENYVTSEGLNLYNQLSVIKTFLKGKSTATYPDWVIEELEKLDPIVFASPEEKRELRDKKIEEGAREYYRENGDLAIPQSYKTKDNFNLGGQLNEVKSYYRGNRTNTTFSEGLITALLEMDSRVFEEHYAKKKRAENRRALNQGQEAATASIKKSVKKGDDKKSYILSPNARRLHKFNPFADDDLEL